MKKILAIVAATAIAAPAMAVTLTQGTHEIGMAGTYDSDTSLGSDFDLALKYGYYFWDNIAVGGMVGYADNDARSTWDLGAYGEYNFAMDGDWVPYVGLNLAWSETDPAAGEKNDAFVTTPNTGVKYFFNSSVAGFLQLNYDIATEDIYTDEDGNLEDQNLGFVLGLRVYIGQ